MLPGPYFVSGRGGKPEKPPHVGARIRLHRAFGQITQFALAASTGGIGFTTASHFVPLGLNVTPFPHRVKWKSAFFDESFLRLARLRQVGLPPHPPPAFCVYSGDSPPTASGQF